MIRTGILALVLAAVAGAAAEPASRWERLGAAAQALPAIAPTPVGEGHLGVLPSGQVLQLRFPVPAGPLQGYWMSVANLVGFSGRGTSYQLVLRRDGPEGPVIYNGPQLANGDHWNADHRGPIEITPWLRPEDHRRGYLDVYACAIVVDDGWTLYRHQPQRPVQAFAVPAPPP